MLAFGGRLRKADDRRQARLILLAAGDRHLPLLVPLGAYHSYQGGC